MNIRRLKAWLRSPDGTDAVLTVSATLLLIWFTLFYLAFYVGYSYSVETFQGTWVSDGTIRHGYFFYTK